MQPTDDSALLRDYCENQSHEAFAELVTRHINLVYSVAVRQVGNPHHAEEITQAVFIILAKKAASLRHDKAISSWLFQATHLTANNFVRSEMRRARREQEAYMQSTLNESDAGLWKEIAPLLDATVARLAEKDRRAIVLRFYEGRNLREVGAALGANEEAAKKRISRALEKLRTAFAKRGVTGTAETIAGTISANSIQAAPATLAKVVTAAAVVKGVTASASILTLTKGALKIMAWTKTKTAVVAGAVVLLATAGLAPHVWRYHLAPDAWRNRFDAAYQLKNGENVRYVKPPFISERMQYYRWRDPEMAAMFRGQPTHISFLQDAEGQPYPDQVGSPRPSPHLARRGRKSIMEACRSRKLFLLPAQTGRRPG